MQITTLIVCCSNLLSPLVLLGLIENAIIDFHPEMPNLLMLNGFSGHGLQQSPATGRAGAELLEHGNYQTLDLSIFGFHRFMGNGDPVFERGIV